jgi:hypothetical protein
MSNRSAIAICSCLLLGACATAYVPPKEGPIATLRLAGLVGSKGSTAYYLKEDAESCAGMAILANGLKSTDSSTVSVRAGAPVVVEIFYGYWEKYAASCRTILEFTPESGATYFLELNESYFLVQRACVPTLQKKLDEKQTVEVPFREVCGQK